MFRGLIDILNLLLWWSFIHVGSFLLMIVAIVYVIQTTTPIETHYTSVQVNETPKRVLVERDDRRSKERIVER
jgi:uncharacterized protein involved in exopolysaccharide biosynthesis